MPEKKMMITTTTAAHKNHPTKSGEGEMAWFYACGWRVSQCLAQGPLALQTPNTANTLRRGLLCGGWVRVVSVHSHT
jgi:hypothetical protein